MKNLKGKLIFTTCLVCMVCIGITAAISYSNASRKLREREGENVRLLAEKSAEQINVWLHGQAKFLDTAAACMEVSRNLDHQYLCTYLSSLLEGYNKDGFLYDIYYTSKENVMAAGSGYIAEPGIDFTSRSWFAGALKADGLYFDAPYRDADSGRIVITISRKIAVDGDVAGVLAGDIFVDTVVDIVNRCEVPENSYAMLLDHNYGLAVHPYRGYAYVDDVPLQIPEIQGNPYQGLLPLIRTKGTDCAYVKDYDGVERAVYIADIGDCNWTLGVAVDKAVLDADAWVLILGFVIAGVVSLAIGVGIVSLMTGRVIKPVGQLARTVAAKDITHEIKVESSDEIGQLSKGFNDLMFSLRGLLKTSGDAVDGIRESSKLLGEITDGVVGGVESVKNEMGSIEGAMEAQSQNVGNGRESLEQFHTQVERFKERFDDMNRTINNVSAKIQENMKIAGELKVSADESMESIKELQGGVEMLEQKSQSITDIVAVINGVSAKTNMLALNASIEAARAGEAGNGFAVVADQIRNLSGQTKKATEDIRGLIEEIQGQIGLTVNQIKASADLFGRNSDVAENVHKTFGEFARIIVEMDGQNQVLYQRLREFIQTGDDIMGSFAEIDSGTDSCLSYSRQALQVAVEQAQAVLQLKDFGEKLNVLSLELHKKAEMFKV